jgi:hypothetical protein
MSAPVRRTLVVGLEILLALSLSVAAACLLTWPMPAAMDQVVVGGGELGGWLWRYWWHSLEADALTTADLPLGERWSQLVALGRYPETGNILDVLFITWPLSQVLDFPAHYNAKVLIILGMDGLCGYALARYYTRSRPIALAACLVAVINPLNIQDINGSGLRQCVLWWVLLYPVFLDRAARHMKLRDAVAAGLCLGLSAAWYWFYGLMAGVFTVLYLGWHLLEGPLPWRSLWRWVLPIGVVALLTSWPFVRPYFNSTEAGMTSLPELSFFLPFPRYETIAEAPLRPDSYEENVLASLHRTIRSSWAADYIVRPAVGERAWPLVVMLAGVLPVLLFRRKRLFWLSVFLFFYLCTLGPYLKPSTMAEADAVLMLGDRWVLRMPFTWLFRWVPGMSRLFGPYRLAAIVVVASVVLVTQGLGLIPDRTRRWRLARWGAALACIGLTMAQVMYRWQVDYVPEGAFQPIRWRAPVKVSHIVVPDFYQQLDPDALEGVIELPLGREQDLLYYYQTIHHHKVFHSWATQGAVPPLLLDEGGAGAGERIRYLAKQEPQGLPGAQVLDQLSREPSEVPPETIRREDLRTISQSGDYRWMVVHERGYFLVDPYNGPVLYRDAVRRLAAGLELEPTEVVEHQWVDYPGNQYKVPGGPVYVPWSAEEINLPDRQMPRKLYMAIFDLSEVLDDDSSPLGAGETASQGTPSDERDPERDHGAAPAALEAPDEGVLEH